MRLTPAAASSGCGEGLAAHAHHEIHRLRERRAHGAHGGEVRQPRREQHVGAGALEGLQAPHRIVKIGAAVQEILGARGEGERKGQAACRLRRGGHALDRLRELVDGRALLAARILDRGADEPGVGRQADGLGARFRGMTKAVLQIGRHRQRAHRGDEARMGQGLLAREAAVVLAQGRRRRRARGRQGRKPQLRHDRSGATVPDIRNDEGSGGLVQRAKLERLVVLAGHAMDPSQTVRPDDCVTIAPPAATP